MKTAIPLQQFKKCIILFMAGVICSALAYALYVINPIKVVLEGKLQMAPGTTLYTIWKKPPIDVYIRVYIFNITNPVEFLKGNENLKVAEVGPYVYQEFLENTNVTFHDNGTVSYIPKRMVYYVPEMSIGDPEKDIISVPNVPMLGISAALQDVGYFQRMALSATFRMLDIKPILNMTVYDYLWGYEDTLVEVASQILPNFVNFQKFGLLDRMYDEGENIVTMNIKQKENMTEEEGRYLSIELYNGSPGLANWGYEIEEGNETNPENTVCNRIRGASEGTVFPANLDKQAVFRIFRKAFCRPLPIAFVKEMMTDEGIRSYKYELLENFLDPPDTNPENECYCRHVSKCLQKGLSDLTPCYYHIPAAMSLPHFLNGDPSLFNNIEGLNPDPKKHETLILLQPDLGIPLFVNSRMQTNLVLKPTTFISKAKAFNNMVVPLFWTDLSIPNLPQDLMFLVKLVLVIMPTVQTVIIYLLGITGVGLIIGAMVANLWIFNQQQQKQQQEYVDDRRDSADLRIPLGYGQYSAIRILPAIKKITSKSDLFT